MKIGYSRETVDQAETATLLNAYSMAGYDGLELRPGQYEPWLPDTDGFRRQYGDTAGMATAALVRAPLNEEGVARLRRVMRFVQALNGERIVYVAQVGREQMTPIDMRTMARRLGELGREACDHGLALSLQNHIGYATMYRKDLETVFESVDDETLWWTVDLAHLYMAGEFDVADVFREFRFMVDNVHLNDCQAGTMRPLGQGEVPLAPVLEALSDSSFKGWLTVSDDTGQPLDQSLKDGITFVRDVVGGRRGVSRVGR